MENIKEHVINEFTSKETQAIYVKQAEKGLWPSEEILVKKYFKAKSLVLDIGCGTGRTTIPLYKLGYKVLGLDLVPAMIASANKIAKSKKLKINYQEGDVTNLKFKDESFDNALFSFNGWTQIPGKDNRINALNEIYRVLKPRGYFIFTTHLRKLNGWTLVWIKEWVKYYLMKPIGFKIDEIDFGDIFFPRESLVNEKTNQNKQFIHIPSFKEVKNQIKEAGFDLILTEMSDIISSNDKQEFPPSFYVCKK
jgi:ubiquinone/menaquinone biosynthesis C-methylase UbiE